MSKSHRLSSNEVASLVGDLLDMGGDGGSAEVKAYKFGSDNLSIMGDYYGLRMINERFCRLARGVFLPFLRMHPRISPFPPEVKSFSSYSDELENFVSLTISRVDELRATQMIMLPPNLVALLTGAYYGGAVTYDQGKRGEFTATENRVISLVTSGLNRALETAWKDLMPLTFTHPAHEENLQFATFVDAEEMVVNCSFIVQLPDADPATIDVLYPLQALKPIAAQLRSRMQSDMIDDDISWRQRLTQAVMQVPLEVTAELATPMVPLNAIARPKAGQVIPVDVSPRPHLKIEGMRVFEGQTGEQDGHAAMQLTRRVKR